MSRHDGLYRFPVLDAQLPPGGVNAATADGAVHFLSETMDEDLIVELAHMKDGLPVEGFNP